MVNGTFVAGTFVAQNFVTEFLGFGCLVEYIILIFKIVFLSIFNAIMCEITINLRSANNKLSGVK